MNRNTVTFVSMSAVFGLGAVFIAKNWLANNQELTEQQINVVVSTVMIPTGTILEGKHLSLAVFPKSLVPEKSINEVEDAIGKVAKDRLYVGEVIRAERLATKGDGSSLASLISENMRAVSIRVNDVVGVAGFLLPGNHVDILNTFRANKKANTEVILSNIKILAVDQSAANNANKPQLVRAVTVEVDLQQAEILMNARSKGYLQLALRNPIDNNEIVIAKTETNTKSSTDLPIVTPTVQVTDKIQTKNYHRQKVELIRGIAQETVNVDI